MSECIDSRLQIENLFEDRYPHLSFFYRFTFLSLQNNTSYIKRSREFPVQTIHQDHDIVYVYGLTTKSPCHGVLDWLDQSIHRQIIFLEDDWTILDSMFESPETLWILTHPRVHIEWFLSKTMRKSVISECIKKYGGKSPFICACLEYKKSKRGPFRLLTELLLRKIAVADSQHREGLYLHNLFKNLLPNFLRLDTAFDVEALRGAFKGVPAIICGAGPSLDCEINQLKAYRQNALILAGGSTLAALSQKGILPHIAFAIDPNEEEFIRFLPAQAWETPIIYGNRVNPHIFQLMNGPHGYLKTYTGGASEVWLEKELQIDSAPFYLDFDEEALSVTTLVVAAAIAFGCYPIILVGVDLAFTSNKLYAEGVLLKNQAVLSALSEKKEAIDKLVRRKNIQGHFVYSQLKWVIEALSLGRFVQKQKEVDFFTTSEKGLPIRGVNYCSLKQIKEHSLQKQYDLDGLLQSHIVGGSFQQFKKSDIEKTLRLLKESTDRVLEKIEGYISRQYNHNMQLLIDLELEEELAYSLFIKTAQIPLNDYLKIRDEQISSSNFIDQLKTWRAILDNYQQTFAQYFI